MVGRLSNTEWGWAERTEWLERMRTLGGCRAGSEPLLCDLPSCEILETGRVVTEAAEPRQSKIDRHFGSVMHPTAPLRSAQRKSRKPRRSHARVCGNAA